MELHITKRQHYVQRKYLTAWENIDNQIWVFKEERKFTTNPSNVMVENYFNSICALSENDIMFILSFLDDKANDFVSKNEIKNLCDIIVGMKKLEEFKFQRNIYLHSIDLLLWITRAISFYEKNPEFKKEVNKSIQQYNNCIEKCFSQDPSIKKITEVDELIEYVKKQTLEEFHCGLEGNFIDIEPLLADNFNINNESKESILQYAAFSFCRTKGQAKRIESILNTNKSISPNVRPILQFLVALQLGNCLVAKNSSLELIINKTAQGFITGDQPCVNTKAKKDEEAEDLVLYFPLSPSLALVITPDGYGNIHSMEITDEKKVSDYNDEIKKWSSILVANKETDF